MTDETKQKTTDVGPSALSDGLCVAVCDKCLMASCWQGIFMCGESRYAGICKKTVAELRELNREHSCYWKTGDELVAA